MTGSAGPTGMRHSGLDLLGIYLNDHLAGATGAVELARRTAGAQRSSEIGDALDQLAAEIAEDRAALLAMMAALGVPLRRYKSYAAWAAEKVGRLKLNGQIQGRSSLSVVVELEMLQLLVAGKALSWRTLRELADNDGRLDAGRLEELLVRARRQADLLEKLRARHIAVVFARAVGASEA